MTEQTTSNFRVSARISSDDGQKSAEFDAASWIGTASDEDIADLEKEQWCSSYAADNVAYALASEFETIADLLRRASSLDWIVPAIGRCASQVTMISSR